MIEKKQYSAEFKREAIRLQATSGKTVAEVERELGLSHGLLRPWKKRFQVKVETDSLELSEVEQLKAELRRIKRELEIVQQERDSLKKTVGIFSKDVQRCNTKRLKAANKTFRWRVCARCCRSLKAVITPG